MEKHCTTVLYIYNKTMENLRNRITVKLVSNQERLFQIDIKNKLHVI